MRQPYPTDLNDEQWELIEAYFPTAKPGGRPRTTDIREVVNAILYVLMGGMGSRVKRDRMKSILIPKESLCD